jgi:hypothetical protein
MFSYRNSFSFDYCHYKTLEVVFKHLTSVICEYQIYDVCGHKLDPQSCVEHLSTILDGLVSCWI